MWKTTGFYVLSLFIQNKKETLPEGPSYSCAWGGAWSLSLSCFIYMYYICDTVCVIVIEIKYIILINPRTLTTYNESYLLVLGLIIVISEEGRDSHTKNHNLGGFNET
nr:unnamed protein product [Callosobruchus chinensis]